MNIRWNNDHTVSIDPPKNPKKITGTRFGAVLGENRWNTPFSAWCEITKAYSVPFEGTKYTEAGKIIEPKQAGYMQDEYWMDIVRPAEVYGADYFRTTRGDFFSDVTIFGGMWDYLERDENGKICGLLEMKTTKRAEDWGEDIPEYYALQAALYAYLLGIDRIHMVCSFLEEGDYEHPEDFVPSSANTIVKSFDLYERYPNFEELVKLAVDWWNEHILGGISPEYDEKLDAEYLKGLRTEHPDTSDLDALLEEAGELRERIAIIDESKKPLEDRLKALQNGIKEELLKSFKPGITEVTTTHGNLKWTVSATEKQTADCKKLAAAGLNEFIKTSTTYTMRVKEIER